MLIEKFQFEQFFGANWERGLYTSADLVATAD
jgi:hypothetical protein